MSTKKTIQINPELFKITGSKTKKNREKKELTIKPVISPNNIKNKLLKRIKDHKSNEIKNTNTSNSVSTNNSVNSSKNSDNTYTDEFYGAIDYLSGLSKKQKQLSALNNKTVKNHSSYSAINSTTNHNPNIQTNPMVSLELPAELTEPIQFNSFIPKSNDVFNVNYKSVDDVPYGCLKNGNKKTYREWKELTRDPELPNLVRPPTPPKKNTSMFLEGATSIIQEADSQTVKEQNISREQRLELIKNKLKRLQDQETQSKMKAIEDLNKIEKEMDLKFKGNLNHLDDLPDIDNNPNSMPDIEELIREQEEKQEKANPKKYMKKTIKRKFTLGKSDKLRRVAVLIKDRHTKKNIINTQKELKKTNITDVRKYLRQHGIIKVGSTCPADILRKTFECAVLTGEVTNTNKETLLHNFLHQDADK